MFYIFFILLLFIASVAVHLLYCRKTKKPGLHAKTFILTAFAFLCIDAVAVAVLQHSGWLDPHSLWGMPLRVTAALIFMLLVPIYLCFYVLTQLTSPSKKILSTLAQQGELAYIDILSAVEKENFTGSRLGDLLTSGCVKFVNGRYVLTAEGQKIAAVLDGMQIILGRQAGG